MISPQWKYKKVELHNIDYGFINIKNNKTSIKDKPNYVVSINIREYRRAIKIDYPEKLATYGTQNEDNQSKNTPQYVLDTTMRKQTQIT
jgi:hypothetical protein